MRLTIRAEEAGRLDGALAAIAGITRSKAQSLISGGHVLVNGQIPRKNGVPLVSGDVLEYDIPEPAPSSAAAQDIPLDIIYEDGDLIVINKPRGMVVHPAPGHRDGTLVNALLWRSLLSGVGGAQRPGIVHRLDMDTTGLLVAAKTDSAHLSLAGQIKARRAGREYIALAFGGVKDEVSRIEKPVGRHPSDRKRMAVTEKGRPAVTYVITLERVGGHTLLRLRLETGRTHQIRVHLSSIGHPVIGDTIYAHERAAKLSPVLMLHAARLSFTHPSSGEDMVFAAPPPEDFLSSIKKLGWSGQEYWRRA